MRGLPAEFSAPAQRAFGLIIPAAPKLAAIFWNTLENKGLIQKGGVAGSQRSCWLGGWRESRCERSEPCERVGSEREPAKPF